MTSITLPLLRRVIRSVAKKYPIEVAYLFGSRSAGKDDAESDIDLAFLLKDSVSVDRRFRIRLALQSDIAEALGVDSSIVDIVILQDASILLQYNAVLAGCPLFHKSRMKRALYEVRVWRDYDDERYYMERDNNITLQKILSSHAI